MENKNRFRRPKGDRLHVFVKQPAYIAIRSIAGRRSSNSKIHWLMPSQIVAMAVCLLLACLQSASAVTMTESIVIVDGATNTPVSGVSWVDCTSTGAFERIDVAFSFTINPGAHGAGLALLPTSAFGTSGSGDESFVMWEAPNLPGSFGVGLDAHNPPSKDRFNADGNFYDRPQHEISLHWDGVEVTKRYCSVAFQDGNTHACSVTIQHVLGGADVSVAVDGVAMFDRFFIAGMEPYEQRPAVGGRRASAGGAVSLQKLTFEASRPAAVSMANVVKPLFERELVHIENRNPSNTFSLAPIPDDVARVLLKLDLAAPLGGCDPWDKCGALYMWDDDGTRYEICRFITPYGRPYSWQVDVTDFLPLLRAKKRLFALDIGSSEKVTEDPAKQKGWLVSASLAFVPGRPVRKPFEMRNLWVGRPNLDKPLQEFFETRQVTVPSATTSVKLRLMVTGHGMAYKNAGEFMPFDRTVVVNGTAFSNTLWKTDCYLNPCRPQGGTWKFDRAGWAPGDVVSPWEIDITDSIEPGETATIDYLPQDYINTSGKWAYHWIETQIVFYQ